MNNLDDLGELGGLRDLDDLRDLVDLRFLGNPDDWVSWAHTPSITQALRRLPPPLVKFLKNTFCKIKMHSKNELIIGKNPANYPKNSKKLRLPGHGFL